MDKELSSKGNSRIIKKKNFEIRFYEKLLEKKPDFVQVLSYLGDVYTRRGFYKEGLDVDIKLVKLRPEDPIVHYNLSCSLSLVGESDSALKELKKAILLGYDDFASLLEDPDLENLRNFPQFNNFFNKIKRLKNNK